MRGDKFEKNEYEGENYGMGTSSENKPQTMKKNDEGKVRRADELYIGIDC